MSPKREEITFDGHGGDAVTATLLSPDEPRDDGRAVLLVHEVYGADAHMADVAGRFAGEGYVVLLPDLYSREGLPGPAGTADEPAPAWDADTIHAAVHGVPDRRALADLDAAARALGELAGVDATAIAVVGFCMGGTLAFMLGCTSTRVTAVVSFYGRLVYRELSESKPTQPLELHLNLDRPLLAFYGARDASIPSADVELLRDRLQAGMKSFQLVTYPEAGHGFMNDRRGGFHAESARDAWGRVLAFLDETL